MHPKYDNPKVLHSKLVSTGDLQPLTVSYTQLSLALEQWFGLIKFIDILVLIVEQVSVVVIIFIHFLSIIILFEETSSINLQYYPFVSTLVQAFKLACWHDIVFKII